MKKNPLQTRKMWFYNGFFYVFYTFLKNDFHFFSFFAALYFHRTLVAFIKFIERVHVAINIFDFVGI